MENPLLKCWNCKSPTTFVVVEDNGRGVPLCSDKCERKYDRSQAEEEDEGW
jgi:hypothetical protein